MKTVILHGQLGRLFGRRHQFEVDTAAEAVRALCANFPEFERHMVQTPNVGYRVKLEREAVTDLATLHHPLPEGGRVTITPVISGGGVEILLGAALIGVSYIPALAAISIGATTLAAISFSVGLSLVLGGVAQLLAPAPKNRGPQERPNNQPSDIFNGPVNTTAQGQPVPVGYGRLVVGGAVISGGLSTEEIPA